MQQPRDAWEESRHPSGGKVGILAAALLILTVTLFGAGPAAAKYASYVVDADTGEVLHGTNENSRNYPASLTKMMTLYLVFEQLKEKRWTLKTPLKISQRASIQPSSKLGLAAGTTITVEDAILALATKSANDIATAVAENISGSERNFALKMTAKARSLGMASTTFRNASGLPHEAQTSTAKDMATLAQALIRNNGKYYHYFSVKEFDFKGQSHHNHNKLLLSYEGADGIKTGYIRASGFNLVASATRDGRRLIGVVFGGRSPNLRNTLMTKLLDKGFQRLAATQGSAPAIAKTRNAEPTRQVAVLDAEPLNAFGGNSKVRRSAANSDTWAVQVGAFKTVDQARTAADIAIKAAAKQLDGGEIRIIPLRKRNGKILHRARIEGISRKDAYQTCRVLKDCMEMRMSDGTEVATSAN
ncbi:MAG: serine hydrolase [Proteobacteria bacterium]|nr:serine hydrolase [Pseudomonadota bacterium]